MCILTDFPRIRSSFSIRLYLYWFSMLYYPYPIMKRSYWLLRYCVQYRSAFQLVLYTMDNAQDLLNERDYPTRKWDARLNIGT